MKLRDKKIHKNQLVANKLQAREASKALQHQVSAAKTALGQAAQRASDVYTQVGTAAQNLIQTGSRMALGFFKDIAAIHEKCKPVEHLYASYQRDLIDYRDAFSPETLSALHKQLAQWQETQIHRILNNQTVEAFDGINEALAQSLQHTDPTTHETPSTLAGASGPSSLVGSVPPGDTEVWVQNNRYEILHGRYRTAVIEYFETGLEMVRPKTGTLEPVVFTPPESAYKRILSATTTDQHIPLPTAMHDNGEPSDIYWIDPKAGRVDWSPELGQFFLTLTKKPSGPQTITVVCFSRYYNHEWLPRLTPAVATQATPKPNATVKTALSPFTRQIFETAQKMGRTDLYGIYALTSYEQLQYAAAHLQGSWTYDRAPRNLAHAKAKGLHWLGDLHEDNKVTTTNCNVANTELAVAARAFGYPVRIVTGFLGDERPALTIPGHEWIEMRVGDRYHELDATPGYTLEDRVAKLNNNIQHKLRMIAEYDQNPRYRERDALYAQLPKHLDAAMLGKLFTTLSELPIEEERLDTLSAQQDQFISDKTVGITQKLAPDRWRTDFHDRDPLQPNQLGRYRGYVIANADYGRYIPSPNSIKEKRGGLGIIEWHIDEVTPPILPERQKLTLKTPLTLDTLIGTIAPDKPDHVSLPGHPGRLFQICGSINDVRRIWDPQDKKGDSLLVEGLQKLQFVPVKVDMEKFDREGHSSIDHRHFAFNAEHGLLIEDYFNDGVEGINLGVDQNGRMFELRISPDYSRILSTALSTVTYKDHTNHAVKYANAFFDHMEGKPVENPTDRALLVRALSLLLRHPPELRNCDWSALAATSYLLSEARRLNIRPEEIKNVTSSAISKPKAVTCDGIRQTSTALKPGCDVEWAASPAGQDPVSVNGLWVTVMQTLSQATRESGFDPNGVDYSKREWLEKLFRKEFKPFEK